MADLRYRLAELERRLANVVRLGTVEALQLDPPAVKVRSGELLTGWRPWAVTRAGEGRSWWPPSVGEQVILLSPGGDTTQAVVLASLYQTAHPAPSAEAGALRLEAVGGISLQAGGDVVLQGGEAGAARQGDAVQVQIGPDDAPLASQLAAWLLLTGAFVPSGVAPVPAPPPAPITLSGTVTEGSPSVRIG